MWPTKESNQPKACRYATRALRKSRKADQFKKLQRKAFGGQL